MSANKIVRVAQNAGFTGEDLVLAVAIAYAESGGNASAIGDRDLAPGRGPSIGLWQINVGDKAHPEYRNVDLTDPQTNANAAFAIYERAGRRFSPWSTFISERYIAFLAQARTDILT